MPLSPQITITPEDIATKNFDISAVTYTSSTATYTATGHTFSTGDVVLVSGLVPDGYNGTFTITGTATNTFTVANTTNAAVTDAVGNAFWTDPTEYEFQNYDATFLPDNNDLANPTINPALVTAQTAIDNAAAALSAANTAYTAAVNSLQASAYAIQNPSTKQLTAIDATGLTVYVNSPTSGPRVVMNSAGLAGYNSSGTATFSISASTGAAQFAGDIVTGARIIGGTMNIGGNAIIDASGYLTATGATITGNITATSGSFTGTVNAGAGAIGGWTLSATQLYSGTGAFMNSSTGNIGGNTITAFSDILSYGIIQTTSGAGIEAAGYMRANGELYAAGHQTTSSAANGFVVTTGGRIARSTASSQRYKENITNLVDIAELNPRKLLDLPVRAFTYKADHLAATDDRANTLIPGFIAEEVDAIYPIAADYLNGPESWNDRIIVPALLALIQDQEKRIAALEAGK